MLRRGANRAGAVKSSKAQTPRTRKAIAQTGSLFDGVQQKQHAEKFGTWVLMQASFKHGTAVLTLPMARLVDSIFPAGLLGMASEQMAGVVAQTWAATSVWLRRNGWRECLTFISPRCPRSGNRAPPEGQRKVWVRQWSMCLHVTLGCTWATGSWRG